MTWGNVAGAAVSVVGGAIASNNSGGSSKASSSSSEPWKAQQPYLNTLFKDAEGLYQGDSSYYQGQLTADQNPNLQRTFDNPNVALDQGMLGNVQGLANGNFNTNATFDQNAMDAVTNNPYVQQQVDSVTRDVNNNARDQMTQNNMNAGFMGSTGSSSQGVQNALVQNNANNTIADASTALRSNAFNQGINTGSQFGIQNGNNNLTGLGLQGNMAQSGLNTMYQNAQQNLQNTTTAGTTQYGLDQNAINADMTKWGYEDDQWANLKRYQDMISGNFQSTQSQGATAYQPSQGENMLGGALAGYGMYNQFNTNSSAPTNYSGISGVNKGSQQDTMLAQQWA